MGVIWVSLGVVWVSWGVGWVSFGSCLGVMWLLCGCHLGVV